MSFSVLKNGEHINVTVLNADIESALTHYYHECQGRALDRMSDYEVPGPCVTIDGFGQLDTDMPFPVGDKTFFTVAELPDGGKFEGCLILRFDRAKYGWRLAPCIIHTDVADFSITPERLHSLWRLTQGK